MDTYEWVGIWKWAGSCHNITKLGGKIYFYHQQMFANFCSNLDRVILFFLGAWVYVDYKEKRVSCNLYWELKSS